jgi:hypothetical protein
MQLSLAGVKNHKMVAPCLKASIEFAHNRFKGGDFSFIASRIPADEMTKIYMESAYLQKHLPSMVGAKQRHYFKTLGGFYAATCSAVDEDLWNDFRGKIVGEIPTSEKDVEFLLRKRFDQDSESKAKLPHKARIAFVIKAWNARVLNVACRKLSWDESKEGFPVFQGCSPQRFAQVAGIPIVENFVRVEE